MSKIQGKQIADGTLTQNLLNLALPASGDTTSGATVGFVESYVTTLSGSTVIGPAEDGSYTDGIFTDFTPDTRIGVAVDRFNEMFKLLAPTPPSGDWTGAFGTPLPALSTAAITARIIGTGVSTSNVVTSTLTPAFSISSSVGTGVASRTNQGTFVFTINDYNGTQIETTTITSGSTSKTTGIMRYTIADPYFGVSGQAGFWTGVTTFSTTGLVSSSITPGITARNLYFTHPTGQSKTGTTFYVDITAGNTPTISSLSYTLPTMTKYVSGVIGLAAGQSVTSVAFNILSACTYFYPTTMFSIAGGITTLTGDIDAGSLPLTTTYATGPVTSRTLSITSGDFESFNFTVTPKNRAGGDGTPTSTGSLSLRMDQSNETLRLKNTGTGLYPTVGSAYDNTESAKDLSTTNTYELQLLHSAYRWPQGNYTSFGGVNYSSITTGDNIGGVQWRWATFFVGNKASAVNNVTITIPSATIGSLYTDIYMFVKIGASGWVDATIAQDVSAPYNDGDHALNQGSSTLTVRVVTFGTTARSGNVYVRMGIKAANTSYTFGVPTMA